jgi:hypothetical protein
LPKTGALSEVSGNPALHQRKDDGKYRVYQKIGYAEYDRRREDGYDRVFLKKA